MPRHSMYGIDAYIDFSSNPNVGCFFLTWSVWNGKLLGGSPGLS